MPRLAPPLAVLVVLLAALSARAGFEDGPVKWRPFGAAAFREAKATGRPVFLVLTAPWNWDHFLLPGRLFARDDVAARLNASWIPVLADASTHPELRSIYSIKSGLVPSFHFLDAGGVPFASFPPMEPDELVFRLDDWLDAKRRPDAETFEPPATLELNESKFANRAARYLVDLSERGELPVAARHQDVDPGSLLFLAEYSRTRLPRRSAETLGRELGALRGGPLLDPVDGGFFRALADSSEPHFEKLLRPNARMGELLALQFQRTANVAVGRDALLVLRFLNEGLRTGIDPIYAESMAADVYDPSRRELVLAGPGYYGQGEAGRRALPRPPASKTLPVGANFAVLHAFATYVAVYNDSRVRDAVHRAGPRLLAGGFEPDGSARSVLGVPGRGNLCDQGDAGLGLLALHSLTGSPEALRAAQDLAASLLRHFADGKNGVFRNVADDADAPPIVRDAPPDPAWNGTALRFLVELAAITRESRWLDVVRKDIAAWSHRVPASGRGLGELGGAAFRLESPTPVVFLTAVPGTAEGERLLSLAISIVDPWTRLRWVAPSEQAEIAKRFGVRFESPPALYLVWGNPSGALHDEDVLRAVWTQAARSAARGD
ncbi:MAG: DUF255 domain-containing protein [bacterium]